MVYSRKHLPGATARWLAEALATGVTMSDSMSVVGLFEFCLARPRVDDVDDVVDMVIDVLAMLVAGKTLRAPGGVGSKILACRDRSLGRLA